MKRYPCPAGSDAAVNILRLHTAAAVHYPLTAQAPNPEYGKLDRTASVNVMKIVADQSRVFRPRVETNGGRPISDTAVASTRLACERENGVFCVKCDEDDALRASRRRPRTCRSELSDILCEQPVVQYRRLIQYSSHDRMRAYGSRI